MKQIELNLKKKLLIVEHDTIKEMEIEEILHRALPDVETKLICKGFELTEGITKKLVHTEEVSDVEDFRHEKIFIDYKDEDNAFTCGFESFISAIEAKGYYWVENNLDKECDLLASDNSALGCAKYRKAFHEWQEAESKTFNPEKTLIFEILL